MGRIPNISSKKVQKILKYADHIDHWIDKDGEMPDLSKHLVKHHGFNIIYSVLYKNDEEDNTVGQLPIRCITFSTLNREEYGDDAIKDFVGRVLKAYGFSDPHLTEGEGGKVHYYESMFALCPFCT